MLSAPVAFGQDAPDWLPGEIRLPEGHEIVRATEVGSFNRLMLVEVAGDASDLLDDWKSALEAAGYEIDAAAGASVEGQFVFSGRGIRTGQVVLMPGTTEDISLFQIDVTLDG